MKKHFLYFVLMGCVALGAISCGSDDDKDDSGSGIVEVTDQKAVQLTLSTPLAATQSSGQPAALSAVNITDAGKAIFEVTTSDGKKYVSTNVTVSGDTYTVSGNNASGTIKRVSGTITRALSDVGLAVDVKFSKFAELGSLEFKSDETLPAKASTPSKTTNETQKALTAYKWTIYGAIVDLKGDVSVFRMFDDGNLAAIRDEAKTHGAEFTAEEEAMFDKSITSIDFDDTLLSINYDNGSSDVATWKWANSSYSQITFTFKEKGMGNKYIPDNCKADIEFKDNRCNLIIYADVKGSKNYTATLTIQLRGSK